MVREYIKREGGVLTPIGDTQGVFSTLIKRIPDSFYTRLVGTAADGSDAIGFQSPGNEGAAMFADVLESGMTYRHWIPGGKTAIPGLPAGFTTAGTYAMIELFNRGGGELYCMLYRYSGTAGSQGVYYGGWNQPSSNRSWGGWKMVQLVNPA
jgi:hypothetical protein